MIAQSELSELSTFGEDDSLFLLNGKAELWDSSEELSDVLARERRTNEGHAQRAFLIGRPIAFQMDSTCYTLFTLSTNHTTDFFKKNIENRVFLLLFLCTFSN